MDAHTLDLMVQPIIAVFSAVALFMVAKRNKWGFVVGLFVQPFWFYTSIINKQWGVFFATVLYTLSFLYGIREWFFRQPSR